MGYGQRSAAVLAAVAIAASSLAPAAADAERSRGPHARHGTKAHASGHRKERVAVAARPAQAARPAAPIGAPVFETPIIPPPYPYSGKLAGDGILGTGILDSNVLLAFGIVRN